MLVLSSCGCVQVMGVPKLWVFFFKSCGRVQVVGVSKLWAWPCCGCVQGYVCLSCWCQVWKVIKCVNN